MPDAAAWKRRSIYQVLTDRFAKTVVSTPQRKYELEDRKYEGGTWRGLISKLDYIQGMGFDAVWISPIIKNIEGTTKWGEAYHGYWTEDMYSTNPHFGTAADLLALSHALHARGMYLMVDVIANHMGSAAITDFSRYVPFNKPEHYHPKSFISNYDDQLESEKGWLGCPSVPLPDLDTEHPDVIQTLYWYISEFVKTYKIDGLRIDTVKHIRKDFWPGFVRAAGVWCLGEVLHGNPDYLASYQPYVGGLLDYGTYYPLKRAFQRNGRGSMYELVPLLTPEYRDKFVDIQQLGTFMENHDMPRFPTDTNDDVVVVKNALAWVLLGDGIPIIYYGQEQSFQGNGDPGSREVMWTSGFGRKDLYRFISLLNHVRNISWDAGFGSNLTTLMGNDVNTMVTQKGPVLMILSNLGKAARNKSVEVTTAFPPGTKLVNVLTRQSLTTASPARTNSKKGAASQIEVWVTGGEVQIYLPINIARIVCEVKDVEPIPSNTKISRFLSCLGCCDGSISNVDEFDENLKGRELDISHWDSGISATSKNTILPYGKPASLDSGEILFPLARSVVDEYALFDSSTHAV